LRDSSNVAFLLVCPIVSLAFPSRFKIVRGRGASRYGGATWAKLWERKMRYLTASLPIVLYVLALVLGFLGANLPFANAELHPYVQWMLFLSLGLASLWAAFGHFFMTEEVAKSIGWTPSPFQHEVAGANLGIALGAVAATVLGIAAAWPVFFVAAGFLWSAAATHILDMVRNRNFAINNAGPVFWWDVLTPLTLLMLLLLTT
jgi:hypothetical protein